MLAPAFPEWAPVLAQAFRCSGAPSGRRICKPVGWRRLKLSSQVSHLGCGIGYITHMISLFLYLVERQEVLSVSTVLLEFMRTLISCFSDQKRRLAKAPYKRLELRERSGIVGRVGLPRLPAGHAPEYQGNTGICAA